MAKENRPVIRINLTLRSKRAIQTAFFKWAVNAGKLIIIFTELIALSALGYRFFIDRQIIDLHGEIDNEIAYIEVQKDREKEFRDIQNRLAHIKSIDTKNEVRFQTVDKISSAVAQGIFETSNLAISERRIEFEGSSLSIFSIYDFIQQLKTDPNILAITLEEVTSVNQGVRFRIIIDLAIPDSASSDASTDKKELIVPTN